MKVFKTNLSDMRNIATIDNLYEQALLYVPKES